MKTIYIILTNSETFPSKIIGLYTGRMHNHIAISLDKSLSKMYSFGRKKANMWFYGGFVTHGIDSEMMLKFNKTTCQIFELEVNNIQHYKLCQILDHFELNQNKYNYNYLGVFSCIFKKNLKRKNSFFCSQFVSLLLKEINMIENVEEYLIPEDIKKIENLILKYDGFLNEYKICP